MKTFSLPLAVAALAIAAGDTRAEDAIASRGELGFESRVFRPDDDAATKDWNTTTIGRLYVDAEKGRVAARARVFSRFDPGDRERSVFIPEELWAELNASPVRLRAGYQMLNWTATEAFHPADVINSRYFDSAIENPEKLGEPMVSARVAIPNGNVEAMFMPFFTRPIFPSRRSRWNLGGPGLALGEALVLRRDGTVTNETFVSQWAVRAQQTWGSADISVHVLQNIDRYLPIPVFDVATFTARPLFQPVTQFGGTYQQAIGGLLVKVEAAYRALYRPESKMTAYGPIPQRDHFLGAIGFEYGVPHDGGGESTWLLEGQLFLPRNRNLPAFYEPLFQHDVLAGYRYAWNDEDSKAIFLGAIVDVARPKEFFVNIGYSQRLGETWGLQAGARFVRVPARNPGAPVLYEWLNDAHQVYANLLRYF